MPTTTSNQHNIHDNPRKSNAIDDEQLRAKLVQAMRDSLDNEADSPDKNLIPATESFKGLFFSDDD